MTKIKAFKIWHSDKTITSIETEGNSVFEKWKNSPDEDIQIIYFYFDEKDASGKYTRRVVMGVDYYGLTKNEEITQDFDDITKVKGHIKNGKYMDYNKFLELQDESEKDYGEGWLFRPETKIVKKIKEQI